MAVGFGVACPKGEPLKKIRKRKKRTDVKSLKAWRDAVWHREREKHGLADTILVWTYCQKCSAIVVREKQGTVFGVGQVDHIRSRRHKESRIDVNNGQILCRACHNEKHRREF